MKKRTLIFLGLLITISLSIVAVAYAFKGDHSFISIIAITSDDHSYKAEYTASGTFPVNGLDSDNSRVNLKGVLKVSEEDGVLVSRENCLTVKARDGGFLVTLYKDITCRVKSSEQEFRLIVHVTNETKNFTLRAVDPKGIEWTIAGYYNFTAN